MVRSFKIGYPQRASRRDRYGAQIGREREARMTTMNRQYIAPATALYDEEWVVHVGYSSASVATRKEISNSWSCPRGVLPHDGDVLDTSWQTLCGPMLASDIWISPKSSRLLSIRYEDYIVRPSLGYAEYWSMSRFDSLFFSFPVDGRLRFLPGGMYIPTYLH